MVSPPWSAPAPPQASSSLLSPGRGSPAVRPKQDKQALPCAGRVSADTVAGSYHPETGGGGAEPLPRASVSWTAVGWKGACWAEIGSSLRPEQRNYPPPPQVPGRNQEHKLKPSALTSAPQKPASSQPPPGCLMMARASMLTRARSPDPQRGRRSSHTPLVPSQQVRPGAHCSPRLFYTHWCRHTLIRLLT